MRLRDLAIVMALVGSGYAGAASPAYAQVAVVDPARLKLGVELAGLLNSESVTRLQMAKALGETLPQVFASNPDFADMEEESPGITKAMLDAMTPILTESTVKGLPVLWNELGAIFAQAMSVEDLTATLDFYRSPVGTRVIALTGEVGDFATVLGTAAKNADALISPDAIRADTRKTVSAVASRLTPAEAELSRRFESSFAGLQLRLVLPQIQAKAAQWGTRPDPETDALLQAATTKVIDTYSAKAETE